MDLSAARAEKTNGRKLAPSRHSLLAIEVSHNAVNRLTVCSMSAYSHLLTSRNVALAGAAATCLATYLHIGPILGNSEPPAKPKFIVAKSRQENEQEATHPYPTDSFPGGRTVSSEYGAMRVFEWGPEEGEKVLLIHGVGTPCVALGSMANEFVNKGYRVMLYGM